MLRKGASFWRWSRVAPKKFWSGVRRGWAREEIRPLEDDQRQRFDLDNEQMAGQALRVLGVAFKEMTDDQEDPERDLILAGANRHGRPHPRRGAAVH